MSPQSRQIDYYQKDKRTYWQGYWEKEILAQGSSRNKLIKPLWKTVWSLLQKLKSKNWTILQSIPLLESFCQENVYAPLFIEAQFMVAKKWKQRKCP